MGPDPFISQSSPDHSPQPRIDFSYYEISGPDICYLICAAEMAQISIFIGRNCNCLCIRVCESNTYQFIIFNCLLVSNVWASSAKLVEQYVCKIILKSCTTNIGIKEFEFNIVWNFADTVHILSQILLTNLRQDRIIYEELQTKRNVWKFQTPK